MARKKQVYKPRPKTKIVCKICNLEFESRAGNIFCSIKCCTKDAIIRKKERDKVEKILFDCPVCKKQVLKNKSRPSSLKTCSRKCGAILCGRNLSLEERKKISERTKLINSKKVKKEKPTKEKRVRKFIERNCELCGDFFKSFQLKSRFCGIKCSSKYRKMVVTGKTREKKNTLICVECSKEFKAVRTDTKFCCDFCHRENRKKVENQYKKVCEYCNTDFLVPSYRFKKAKCCSDSCRAKNTQKNMSVKTVENRRRLCSEKLLARYKSTPSMLEKNVNNLLSAKFYGKTRTKRGTYFSTKNNINITYRSSWEESVFLWLDKNEEVSSYECEKLRLKYKDPKNNSLDKIYIPDILLKYKNGKEILVEIKPKAFFNDPINIEKFKAAKEYCKQNNIDFEIWSDDKIEEIRKSLGITTKRIRPYIYIKKKDRCSK